MQNMKKSVSSFLAVLLVAAGFLSGCGKETPSSANVQSSAGSSVSSTGSEASSEAAPAEVDLSLPISKEPITLSYFINMNGAMSATMPTYADVAAFKEMEARTNIHIDWIHPTGGNEQFALMVASDNLPDMINWPFGNAKGGAEALIRDKIILPLSEEDLKTYAVNYMTALEKNPIVRRNTVLDDGTMYQFVNFNYDWAKEETVDFQIKGPYIRMDWVDKVGLKAPTTIDELYEVLKAFKEQNVNGQGNVIPFVDNKDMGAVKAIAGSFGVRWSMQSRNGEVVFGPTQPEFRTYLETMNKWYSEGLINNDFPVMESTAAKILSSEGGFTISSMGSGLTMQRESLLESDPGSNLDSIPYTIGPDGYQCLVDDKGANPRATCITTSNKYVTESLRWIDYAYSPEGSLLTTYGIEGESYNIVDGKPILSEKVMFPSDGRNQEETIARYAIGPINYPNARDIGFYEQVNLNSEQKVRIQTNWKTGTEDILLPPVTLTTDESVKYGNLMADIKTYVEETTLKFIIGQKPISEFDDFVSRLESMNLAEAIAIQKAAVDRFNQRTA